MENLVLTLESKILNKDSYKSLLEYGRLYNHILRKVYNLINNNIAPSFSSIQKQYHRQYNIPVRVFKSVMILAKAMYNSQKVLNQYYIKKTKRRIKKYGKKIKAKKQDLDMVIIRNRTIIHNMNLRLNSLRNSLKVLQNKKVFPIVFGSSNFYKKQWTDPKYVGKHSQWLEEWRISRNSFLYFVGTAKESNGNQLCQLKNLSRIVLKLPYSFAEKELALDVNFSATGFSENKKKHYAYLLEAVKEQRPLTYKIFQRSNGCYYVQVSFSIPKTVYYSARGTIGVDFNYDLVATSEISGCGNPINFKNYKYVSNGRSSGNIRDQLSLVCDKIIKQALKTKKNIVIEDLDLENKKVDDRNKVTNRKLSLMAYQKFLSLLVNKCLKNGVWLQIVHPAYTSVIGKWKYSKRFGISTHLAAAYVIARRGFGFKDNIPFNIGYILHSGEASSWLKRRCKHYWSQWHFVSKNMGKCLKKFKSVADARSLLLDHTRPRFNLASVRLEAS